MLICKSVYGMNGEVYIQATEWPIRLALVALSVAWSDYEYSYTSLDGMLVHCKVTPSITFAGAHLFTWVQTGPVRVKCLVQENNTMTLARAQAWNAWSRVGRTNYEATRLMHPMAQWGQILHVINTLNTTTFYTLILLRVMLCAIVSGMYTEQHLLAIFKTTFITWIIIPHAGLNSTL